jgi:hypothetical protein
MIQLSLRDEFRSRRAAGEKITWKQLYAEKAAQGIPMDQIQEIPVGQNGRITGLGDVIHSVTQLIGLPTCGGCLERQKWLNETFPMGK